MKLFAVTVLLFGLFLMAHSSTIRLVRQVATGNVDAATRIRNCERTCLTTNEYNPVCGTNGLTYSNDGKLNCAIRCGAAVELSRRGTCQPV
ncbi:uncharacterized protein CBL_06942 [Carabus blaptoides fortunei]